MSLYTHSKFYYGHTVDPTNNAIDFSEGGPELQATIATGEYTLTEYVQQVDQAINDAGGQVYTVDLDRATGLITISAPSNFSLLVASGTRSAVTAYTLMGFTVSDRSGLDEYTGDSLSGETYTTQFILQNHIPIDNWSSAIAPTVNESASGKIEVVKFGTRRFTQMQFLFVTNQPGGQVIRENLTGVEDFLTLMDYLVTKAPVEFMPNENAPNTFQKLLLEATTEDRSGTGFKLIELYDRGLPKYFDSGTLKFRLVE